MLTSEDNTGKPKVSLHLSRSTYPLQSSVLGTIHVHSQETIKSIQLYVAGRSRLDARWHDIHSIQQRYGYKSGHGHGGGETIQSHPCHLNADPNLPEWIERLVEDSCFGKRVKSKVPLSTRRNANTIRNRNDHESVCFWSTNVLTLWKENENENNEGEETEDPKHKNAEKNIHDHENEHTEGNIHEHLHEHEQENEQTKAEELQDRNMNIHMRGHYLKNYQVPLVDNNYDEKEENNPTPLMMSGSDWFKKASRYLDLASGSHDDENQHLNLMGYDSGSDGDDMSRSSASSSSSSSEESTSSSAVSSSSSAAESMSSTERNNSLYNENNNSLLLVDTADGHDQEHDEGETDEEIIDIMDRMDINDVGTRTNIKDHQVEAKQRRNENVEVKNEPLHFTFRADLTDDLVPTVNAVCARYYYSAVVYARTVDGKSIVVQAPFTVVTPANDNQNENKNINNSSMMAAKTKIAIGSVHALAHTRPYLVPLSITYKAEPWSISVKRNCNRGNYDGVSNRNTKMSVQSIPIQEDGYKCGILTITGGSVMSPGGTISLQFDFASVHDHINGGDMLEGCKGVLPCYQVSACLQGEEYAIGVNGSRKKCRSYVFDTDHEKIHPVATNGASLSLTLPAHCPITVSTDFVEIGVTCRIDLTVQAPRTKSGIGGDNGSAGDGSYRFLTVQFPCRVVQSAPELEPIENGLSASFENKLLDMKWSSDEYPVHRSMFCSEVIDDLNMLSLHQLNKLAAISSREGEISV